GERRGGVWGAAPAVGRAGCGEPPAVGRDPDRGSAEPAAGAVEHHVGTVPGGELAHPPGPSPARSSRRPPPRLRSGPRRASAFPGRPDDLPPAARDSSTSSTPMPPAAAVTSTHSRALTGSGGHAAPRVRWVPRAGRGGRGRGRGRRGRLAGWWLAATRAGCGGPGWGG